MYRKNFNWTEADQRYYETYQAPATGVTLTDLHTQLVGLTDYQAAAAIERDILKQTTDHAAIMAAMEQAVNEAREMRENVAAAIEGETTVTVENGYLPEQEQATSEQAQVITEHAYGKVRASRMGKPFPRLCNTGPYALFPDAYSCKRGEELEQARAFFA